MGARPETTPRTRLAEASVASGPCMTLPRRNTQPGGRRTGISESAFRRLQEVIAAAGIPDGPHACPKGLRRGFGVQAVSRGIALNIVQKWLGHAQLTTTSASANAVGAQQRGIAAPIW